MAHNLSLVATIGLLASTAFGAAHDDDLKPLHARPAYPGPGWLLYSPFGTCHCASIVVYPYCQQCIPFTTLPASSKFTIPL